METNETRASETEVSEVTWKNHPEFGVHILNENGKQKARAIQNVFNYALNNLENLCMTGREFSLCKTKLEEACFFAKKAMAINLDNQET